MKKTQCKICKRTPEEIGEYIRYSAEAGMTPEEYVMVEEGTYNKETGRFYCTKCYIEIGMPTGKA